MSPIEHRRLGTPVQFLPGVGPARAELLQRLGLETACDVLFYFPRTYRDLSSLRKIRELDDGCEAAVCGRITEIDQRTSREGRSVLGALIQDDSDALRLLWFNQPYQRQRLATGQRVLASGTARRRGLMWEMAHPTLEWLGESDQARGRIWPVYAATEGLSQAALRGIVERVLEECVPLLEEVLPPDFLDEYQLWPIQAAVTQIHQPADAASLEQAQRRLVFQELLVLQLALALRRWQRTAQQHAPALPVDSRIDGRIRRLFPFALTADQEQAVVEITTDMARESPMYRMLQGDVGSGKTVVAEYAMLLAVAHGHQAVMMVPTEILARQHYQTLRRDLKDSRVRLVLLAGGLTAAEREAAWAKLARGEADIVVGTHALLQRGVPFRRLGLAIVDEQHKFGVRQRAGLRQAGMEPHYLVMTATPIPRTLALTLFGDLEVSTLRQPPPGRQPVHTYLADDSQRGAWWDFVRKQLHNGRQAYVIAPWVEEAEDAEAASAEHLRDELAHGELAGFQVGLVHGRLSASAKDSVMERFRSGALQVLVATLVVEVGIDVPNATLMTIERAERFGLAQLHQLRGRIARGRHPGFLAVFAAPGTDEARRRLEAFAATQDGFELADVDFQLRGPGDLLGTAQHGLPPLRIADLLRDGHVLLEARRAANDLLAKNAGLSGPAWDRLRRMVIHRYGAVLELADAG